MPLDNRPPRVLPNLISTESPAWPVAPHRERPKRAQSKKPRQTRFGFVEKPRQPRNPLMPAVTIYTDGACSPNPGPGGWGALLVFVSPTTGEIHEREISGHDPKTTNNRMEMMAAIVAIESLTKICAVEVVTDSQLLQKGASAWIHNWRRKGFSRKNGVPMLNADLWRRLDEAMGRHEVRWTWVRGHNGHVENERVDRLAVAARYGKVCR